MLCFIDNAIDFDEPDLNKFPLFSSGKAVEAIIGPGEVLFIPAYWWHYVESLGEGEMNERIEMKEREMKEREENSAIISDSNSSENDILVSFIKLYFLYLFYSFIYSFIYYYYYHYYFD